MVGAQENYSRERATRLVNSCFHDLQKSVEGGYLPSSAEPELELAEQRALASDCIRQSKWNIATRTFPGSLLKTAASLCATQGWIFEDLTEEQRQDLLEGVTRAIIEQQRLFILRLGDRLAPFVPADPLFPNDIGCTVCSPMGGLVAGEPAGPTVKQAVSAYLEHGRKKWTLKTHAGRTRQLRYLVEHFGPERALAAISAPDVRAYRDAIRKLRSNHHRTGAQTFAAKQTENENHQIGCKTAALMFEGVKALFRWATDVEGYLPSNPAEKVRIETPKKVKGTKARRPFSKAELETLFSQPLFGGCASAHRRFQPGEIAIRDDYYWIPILGFYTGARLGELVQLHLQDVRLQGATPYLEITEDNGGKVGSANAKHVKSAAGIRRVPLHPDVLELGFADFLKTRCKHRKPVERLFYRIPFGSDGQASTVFSKWFARFLDKAGLSDSALVFHSFRHNAEDALRDALQPQYVIDRIIGHCDPATSAAYGEGISLEVAHDAIRAMRLKLRLPAAWAQVGC